MAKHNLTVANHAVAGSLAAQWATEGKKMASIIQQNPTARWVWLTIGGNDCIAGLPQRIPISVMMAELNPPGRWRRIVGWRLC